MKWYRRRDRWAWKFFGEKKNTKFYFLSLNESPICLCEPDVFSLKSLSIWYVEWCRESFVPFWSIGSSRVEMKIKYFLCSVLFARLRGDGWMGGTERREQSTRNPYNSGTVNDDSRQREATHWHFYRCMIFMRKCINIRLMPWFQPPHLIHRLSPPKKHELVLFGRLNNFSSAACTHKKKSWRWIY